ncbi:efflux RND transporter periplasmic adaptor subunit [Pontibaca salina]|uniref:HlyD family efflux transporter periplasmic adaptor subunit n=1 Tax=Pontibaca salina TaxID=2795731 RepID=A0A934LZT5_9RHOB|nr:HlyD family efflux transporter periplasmic adaptor subunit [Pontibaca salina]MBI6629320.1 HlyD family efflux transporter periplasmic adaptor subunit [Pontibaca salina]
MRFLRQSLFGVFLAGVTLALLLYAGQVVISAIQTRLGAAPQTPPARERVFAVNLQTATSATATPILHAYGAVQSRRTLELRAAVGGRVIELADAFEEGGVVRKGKVLLRIDPADTQAALDRAESDLMDAGFEVRDAERGLELARAELAAAQDQAKLRERAAARQNDLQERGVGSAALVETADLAASAARLAVLSRRQAVAQAEARVDQAATRQARAEIALDEARRQLDETTLTAGFDGTLSEVRLVEGRLVTPNEQLALLVDTDALEVAFRVSTAQYARLLDDTGRLIAAPVAITLDAAGVEFMATGKISRDSAATGEGQSGRLIFARLEDARGFKPGDFVTVAVQEPPLDNVVRLPASSYDAASGTVLVLDGEDRLRALAVTLLRRQGDEVLLRGAGLAGQEVVIGRTPLLGEGIRVRPLRDEAALGDEQVMLDLTEERRAELVALVQGDGTLPDEARARLLAQLDAARVPVALIRRIENRRGG